jgi:peptidyl-prolyl cis-trans isomerase C
MKVLLVAACATLAWAQAPADPVVITVGSIKITKSQFEQIIASLNERQRGEAASPEGKKKLAEQFAELQTLVQEARARKLESRPVVMLQMDQVLAQAMYQEFANAAPDEAALRAYYAAHKGEWEEVKARHILLRFKGSPVPVREGQKDLTEDEAKAKAVELRAKIVGGADFAAVAKAESDDTGSGSNGGDLGAPFGKGRMVPEFEAAAFSLPVKEISQPVRSQFGYHIIQVLDHSNKPFEAVRAEIEQKMKPELGQKGLEELKKKTPVSFNEEYFKPAPAPPKPAQE